MEKIFSLWRRNAKGMFKNDGQRGFFTKPLCFFKKCQKKRIIKVQKENKRL